jgi:hypothetical protein
VLGTCTVPSTIQEAAYTYAKANADPEDSDFHEFVTHGKYVAVEKAAKIFIGMYWPQIERVAKALLKHRRLTRAQVERAAGRIPKHDLSRLFGMPRISRKRS